MPLWNELETICTLTTDPVFFFFWQTNELVMSLDDDDKLILQDGQTLRTAGVGESLSLLSIKHSRGTLESAKSS